MATALVTHPASQAHAMPTGHPESVARIEAVERALAAPDFRDLLRVTAPEAAEEDLSRAHPADHLAMLRAATPLQGYTALDGDTYLSPRSLEAALHAAGGACAAVDLVMNGTVRNAFVAARPPGHHAERDRAMGFCLLGNAAIAALRALDHHGLARVAVVDFDVHHGNGTQDILWNEARALYVSSHQSPLYPGTGAEDERGAHGNILNIPLSAGSGSVGMRAAYDAQVFPAIERFAPELIVISAGFDAHRDDPLGGLGWSTGDFIWITRALCDIAARHCGGRVVSCLEGGYDLNALAASVAAHVGVLQESGA